jgi:hypothetical protein
MERDRNFAPTGRKSTDREEFNPPGRPAPEIPDPVMVVRLKAFLARISDPSIPVTRSPLEELRAEIFGFTRHEGSGIFGPYSYSQYCHIEAGARESLPRAVIQMIERIAGAGTGLIFERGWRRFREHQGREMCAAAEKKLFPGGPGYGMCE